MATDIDTGVNFWISAKKETSVNKNGKSFHNFSDDDVFYEVSNFKSDDSMSFTSKKKHITLKNLNSFSLYVTTVYANGDKEWEFELKEKKQLTFSLTDTLSKFFVSKKENIIKEKTNKESTKSLEAKSNKISLEGQGGPEVVTTYEALKFSLQAYGEKGVKLFRNGEEYFLFEKEGLSGVKLNLQDNDYIDIGPDEGFQSDIEFGPTIDTIDNNEIRMKKRRLRVENKNAFFITVIAEINHELKAYVIGSNSESFIFFGKESCRLYMYREEPELENKSKILSQKNEIIIYPSFVLSDSLLSSKPTVRINGKEYTDMKRTTLKNLGTLKFSIDRQTRPLTIKVVIGSDPSNPNILITEISDTGMIIANTTKTNSSVIRPGGVGVLEVTLNSSGNSNQFQFANRLIKTVRVYETSRFRIPINTVPYIKMKGTVKVDVLNGTLEGLKNVIKAERVLQDSNAANCDALFQMVYTTYSPFANKTIDKDKDEEEKEAVWFFAVLFSHQLGMEQALIQAAILLKLPNELAKYKLSHMTMKKVLEEKKKTTDYKTKVTELMGKDNSTFLFELDISDTGFIACMYRPVKEIKEEKSGLVWLNNLLKSTVKDIASDDTNI
ncbi:hypothetical protein [Rickettsiella endosymbiont of Rhagonycha lignosa]|uniref:hypothetical protein n=1 Tax=Rickettsiella endosymbiont of Rhagonycha lignosa TaxID=3077937 RepID=UPI00313ACEF6